jgi:hypothetical protein
MAMAHVVATFVAALQTDTRRRAMFPFHDPERFNRNKSARSLSKAA